jgi:superfamily II DNA or RNA helicase
MQPKQQQFIQVAAWPCLSRAVDRNQIRQLAQAAQVAPIQRVRNHGMVTLLDGTTVPLVPSARNRPRGQTALVDQGPDPARWLGDAPVPVSIDDVLAALRDAFTFREARCGSPGLRAPQIGAVHSVLGYWTTGVVTPATVVMPTGTGKTETMLALLATGRIAKLLVLVPTDALRTQIVGKFESWGVLKAAGVLDPKAPFPVVGQVAHRFSSTARAEEFANSCNIVVATPSVLHSLAPETRAAFLATFSHLFVDEAHHVAARTWTQVRDEFAAKPVVQFTATPFREDGRALGGKLLYSYPLRAAQEAGYFAGIDFISVLELGDKDQAIATRALARLREDMAAGHDHLLMARVHNVTRAEDVIHLYQELGPEFSPVVLHSRLSKERQRLSLQAIKDRTSRVIVCVNMLGEGFDLPALKIAALHDPQRSLSVTLQFVGRFARAGERAAVVVSRPAGEIDMRLRRLYSEDADWNRLVSYLSEEAIGTVEDVSDFEEAFGTGPEQVALRSLLPAMSTVVFRSEARDWEPERIYNIFPEDKLLTFPIGINQRDHVAWFVTEMRTPVKWGELQTVEEVTYDLYVIYWDATRGLLYINSSNKSSVHQDLAEAIVGTGARRVTGEDVYRVMAGLARLVPTNVGVLDTRNRNRRFSFHVGADVSEGFTPAETQTKSKTNIFASGFADGVKITVGASLKGRIWSHRVASNLREWTQWCDGVGTKVTDATISVDDVMRGFIRPKLLEARPELVPLALEWPWELLVSVGDALHLEYQGRHCALLDADFTVVDPAPDGDIRFTVDTPDWSLPYRLEIAAGAMRFVPEGDDAVFVARNASFPLSAILNERGLLVHFESEALLTYPALLLKPDRDLPPYDAARLSVLDWTGIDLTVESQGPARRVDSIQARAAEHLRTLGEWQVILDDDGTGEVADLVALRVDGQDLVVHLVHCKYVTGGRPRQQVADLYEVCGQAHKSTTYRRNVTAMVHKLIKRETLRLGRGEPTGFLKGSVADLHAILDQAPRLHPAFHITVAQPGLMQAGATEPQLRLLAAADIFVRDTANADFDVWCSP